MFQHKLFCQNSSRLHMDHMDPSVLFFTFTLSWASAAARSTWTDKPWILVNSSDIKVGENVEVSCTLPIDYRGGECRLYRGDSRFPFRLMTALEFICVFSLSSSVLLGPLPVGSVVSLRCDYQLQQYTSVSSDGASVVVWGTSPSPTLSVSHPVVSPEDNVEVICSPPHLPVYKCHFYRDHDRIAEGPCRRNLTGSQLAIWAEPAVLLPVNLTCRYRPNEDLYFNSDASNNNMLFVVDAAQASSSLDCKVPVNSGELVAFRGLSWTFASGSGTKVKVHGTDSGMQLNSICDLAPPEN
uniref:uncharacterized protein LOC131129905 n=1 Tax=Doryrhamphus excisus TaxID=161450 RepID=UPI0025AE9F3A|nr:uncharacterized protein LOC131129905 [Doryrhamphus excisus]